MLRVQKWRKVSTNLYDSLVLTFFDLINILVNPKYYCFTRTPPPHCFSEMIRNYNIYLKLGFIQLKR